MRRLSALNLPPLYRIVQDMVDEICADVKEDYRSLLDDLIYEELADKEVTKNDIQIEIEKQHEEFLKYYPEAKQRINEAPPWID